nr:hypothetical protein [Tanacetum cinerariifolium]
MKDSRVDVILDLLKRNDFARAEMALPSKIDKREIGEREGKLYAINVALKDVNCLKQKCAKAGEYARMPAKTRE